MFQSRELVGDILWIQRMSGPIWHKLVADIPPALRPKVVYDIDDLMWDAHVNRVQIGAEKEHADTIKRRTLPTIAGCDAVTCSTPELAEHVRPVNPNTFVVGNGIDFDIRDWTASIPRPAECEGKIVIGWSGGSWHEGDLDCAGKALRDTLLAHPECHFVGQGQPEVLGRWLLKMKLPRRRWCIVDRLPFETHPSAYSLFDVGIAALASNEYNRCKSELRLMELGARGIPYVASRIAPYIRFHCQAHPGGFLAKSYDDWRYGLEMLVAYENRRKEMGQINTDYVKAHYNLRYRALQLEAIFKEVLNGQESKRPNPSIDRNRVDGLVSSAR